MRVAGERGGGGRAMERQVARGRGRGHCALDVAE